MKGSYKEEDDDDRLFSMVAWYNVRRNGLKLPQRKFRKNFFTVLLEQIGTDYLKRFWDHYLW